MSLETKMVSLMKWTKDTMDSPPPSTTIDSLVAVAKSMGATHCEIACPLGKNNSAAEIKRWADKIHGAGLLVTFRPADVDMEGIYGRSAAVGPLRWPEQNYIAEVVTFIKNNPTVFKDGDEWAPFPERTEGIFQDATSWIWPNDPGTYTNFFVNLANQSKSAFDSIVKKVQVGLSTNNASELLSGWMPKTLSDTFGYVCVDHYADGKPAQLESDLRAIFARYGKPIYLQESAPSRVLPSSAADLQAYFAVLNRLVADGVLKRYGYWGAWSGTPEGCINSDFSLNEIGLGVKALFTPIPTPAPSPAPAPTPLPTPTSDQYAAILKALDSHLLIDRARLIVFGTDSNTLKMSKLRTLLQ